MKTKVSPHQITGLGDLSQDKHYLIVAACYIALHFSLFLYGTLNSQAWLLGDRAGTRLAKIEALKPFWRDIPELQNIFLLTGSPGDFLYHALLLHTLGKIGLIISQIVLGFVGMTFLYLLAYLLFSSRSLAFVTTLTYILLPGTLEYPHLLVTEALVNPLLIVSVYYVATYFMVRDVSLGWLIVAALALSVIASIRLIFAPLIFFVTLLITWDQIGSIRQIRNGLLFAGVACLLPVAIMSFYYVNTGSFSYGESDHSISLNLAGRVKRIARMEGIENETLADERYISLHDYTAFVVQHPIPMALTLRSDLINILLNPGVNHLFGRYLNLYSLSELDSVYRDVRDQGITSLATSVFGSSVALITVNVIGLMGWLTLLAFSLKGLYLILANLTIPPQIRLLFICLPSYILVSSQLVQSVSYRHRTPIEFMIATMFAVGILYVLKPSGKERRLQFSIQNLSHTLFLPK